MQDPRAPADTAPDSTKISAGYALFDHQRAAADRVVHALGDAPRKVILHMPTGAGKTRTAMHIVAEHLRRSEPTVVCWLAQNAELLDQAADEFEKAWQFLGNRETNLVRFWGTESRIFSTYAMVSSSRALQRCLPSTTATLQLCCGWLIVCL